MGRRPRLLAGILAAALFLHGIAASVSSEVARWVPVGGKSHVTFEASHPFGDFTGKAENPIGDFRGDPSDLRLGVTGELRVPAAGLRTGLDGRDRDMRALLEAAQHPEIRFTVERVEASFHSVTDRSDLLLSIRGVMRVRGVERPAVFTGRARLRDDKLWVRGEGSVRMSDFGIRPPTRFFLSVEDRLRLRFELLLMRE